MAEPAGWSEREAAVQLRDESDASGGCLPSLTLIVGRGVCRAQSTHKRRQAERRRLKKSRQRDRLDA
jgi:hypothetical protein